MGKLGRMYDVWFEDSKSGDSTTVYADAGMKDTIASVEGVRTCYNIDNPVTYSV